LTVAKLAFFTAPMTFLIPEQSTEIDAGRKTDVPNKQCSENVSAHQNMLDGRRSRSNLTTQQVVKYL